MDAAQELASPKANGFWANDNCDSPLLGVNTPRSDEDRLKLMSLSTKRTSWNEFSTTMASAVICLSKGQKFNFSKYIFDSLVRNVDSSSMFYMYPRFIQLIIQNQVGDLSTHTTRYISSALTRKVFANMRRVGKGFLGVEKPLFEGMLTAREIVEEGLTEEQVQADGAVAVAVQETVAEDVANEAIPSTLTSLILPSPPFHKLEIIKLQARVKRLERANKVKSSKLRCLKKVGTSQRIESSDDMEDVFNQGRMIDDLDKDEGIELVVDQVKDADIAENEGRHAAEQAKKPAEIYNLDLDHPSKVLSMQEDDSEVQEVVEPSIPAAAPTVVAAYTRRRKRVITRDLEEELSSKTHGLKDKGKGILIESPKPMKKKDQIELDAEYARKLHKEINKDDEEINKDIDWDATESEARKNMMIYLKNTDGYKMDFFKGMSINETPAQKAAKRRKLNEEAQEAKDLKKHLEIVNDEDDDVFTEATSLGRKVPVVDYQIVMINNKPRYKIIKADETHQLYISFITLLKNFDREDLEDL
uniref:Uncharacterized protein n=1 Tax=Tanacetum cinerariifolium TaxID=118510 RepID=A0A6L2MDZ6_TANCI|nr:hypothetical protein [Tanacetum cinerariifolium]